MSVGLLASSSSGQVGESRFYPEHYFENRYEFKDLKKFTFIYSKKNLRLLKLDENVTIRVIYLLLPARLAVSSISN